MSEFYGSVMTALGADLLTQALAGTATIQFTAFVTGDGSYSEAERTVDALQAMTALKSQKQSVSFQSVTRPTSTSVVLDATVDNSALSEGYYVREVGIYAKDTINNTSPILYAIAVAQVADFMPPYNGLMPVTITEKFIATVNNSANITIVTSGAYADASDLGNITDLTTDDKSSAVKAINEVNANVGDPDSLNTTDKDSLVKAINEVNGIVQRIAIDSAAAHNAIYRGKKLGTAVTAAQYTAISAGTFDDMYIGDYWEIDSVIWRIAAFDYWLHCGDTECTTHHVVIVPDTNLDTQKMNDTNTTAGGYVGSKMYTDNMATAKSKVTSAFGASHILSHREYLTNAITSGYASAGAWYDSDVELMNEQMVYGCSFFTPHNSLGATIPNTHTIDKSQLPLFRHDHSRITNRATWWLRDVVSATSFALVGNHGLCNTYGASNSLGVRPAFAIKA